MSDGAAVAMFNRGEAPAVMTIKWSDFTKASKPVVRDVWRHEYVKPAKEEWTATVPRHGVVMLHISSSAS